MNKTIAPLFVALSILSSCDPGEETPEMLCTPGQSDACACENGLEGAQVCAEDGMAFGVCMCEEPPPACSPGDMDACVCDGQEIGMRECGEDSVFGECMCENDTSSGDHIPGTQWVLRDKDGNAVPAVFEPVCEGEKKEECKLSADEKTYPCAFIHYFDGNALWVAYDLETGKPENCYRDLESWDYTGAYYDNETCEGIPYAEATAPQKFINNIIKVDGKIYYIDTKKTGTLFQAAYYKSGDECFPLEGQANYELRPYEELPISMSNILVNAPYTITIE